jgi:hypothetical protein
MQVTLKYGLGSVTREVPEGTTVASLISDHNNQAVLGHGNNVEAFAEEGPLDSYDQVGDGEIITLRAKANAKAQSSESK